MAYALKLPETVALGGSKFEIRENCLAKRRALLACNMQQKAGRPELDIHLVVHGVTV